MINYFLDECIDTDTQCGANPGLPEMTCEMAGFEFVKVKCPKLCHICGELIISSGMQWRLHGIFKQGGLFNIYKFFRGYIANASSVLKCNNLVLALPFYG